MLIELVAASSISQWLMRIPVVKRVILGDDNKILLRGDGVKYIPLLDPFVEKYTAVPMTSLQRQSTDKFVRLARTLVNTRAFELISAKLIHDKWPMKSDLNAEIRLL